MNVTGYFIRQAYEMRFGLTEKVKNSLTKKDLWQLCQCRNDEARRLLLGVSIKEKESEL